MKGLYYLAPTRLDCSVNFSSKRPTKKKGTFDIKCSLTYYEVLYLEYATALIYIHHDRIHGPTWATIWVKTATFLAGTRSTVLFSDIDGPPPDNESTYLRIYESRSIPSATSATSSRYPCTTCLSAGVGGVRSPPIPTSSSKLRRKKKKKPSSCLARNVNSSARTESQSQFDSKTDYINASRGRFSA